MPKIGEIRKAREIGRNNKNSYIWQACISCGKERWVFLRKGKALNEHCNCYHPHWHGAASHLWKGGRRVSAGYIWLLVDPKDFFFQMTNVNGYVLEHRLIMAKHLNRCLLSWEVVHHKNGIKTDNRLENLELIGCTGKHNSQINKRIKQLEKRVAFLEAENVRLQFMIEQYKKDPVSMTE